MHPLDQVIRKVVHLAPGGRHARATSLQPSQRPVADALRRCGRVSLHQAQHSRGGAHCSALLLFAHA